jgi:2-deoxy-D-gluconate 3-dehydrogenase
MTTSMFDLTGKKALVTGASRGLGLAMAGALAEHGADVAVVGTQESITGVAEQLHSAYGRSIYPIQADFSDRAQTRRAFNESLDKLGTLDILVVSHGVQRRQPAAEFSIENWELVLEVNLTSMFMLDQMAAQIMLAKGQGKIINIASLQSFIGGLTIPAYAAAKGGVARLTQTLANEWAAKGLNVNAIAPGYFDTDMNEALKHNAERYSTIMARIPAGRWGNPEDMRGAVVFLASDASRYVNGAIIPVDGGWLGR